LLSSLGIGTQRLELLGSLLSIAFGDTASGSLDAFHFGLDGFRVGQGLLLLGFNCGLGVVVECGRYVTLGIDLGSLPNQTIGVNSLYDAASMTAKLTQ
jgi:hypothetical protein